MERETYAGFAGAWYELRQSAPLIEAVVATVANPAQRSSLKAELEEEAKHSAGNLVAALRQILDGERDEEALCERLYYKSWMLIHAILQGIADPESLKALLTDQPQER